jgi:O-antigen biosynthesis protein WbqV
MTEKVQPIEIADLLGRPEIRTDNAAIISMIRGKRVLVTGAGGSIGSELCRQIASLKPAELITADFGEFNLYSIDKELSEKFPNIPRKTALFDVRDAEMVSFWFNEARPEIVFHAAALKHVPLVEDHPLEGVKTNVFGTIHIAEACVKYNVAAMVTISTDKAVNPSNAMGATKRLAESYCQGLDQLSHDQITTNFVTVRFGNVLGSAGSVVPLFQRQIEEGGPVTVTHPDIKRYFMTIPEAVTLVLQAGARGMRSDRRRGGIYVLDMGQPVKIIDLARHMIQLSGLRPGLDIQIKVMGLRPGEKLYEEVVHNDESLVSSGDDPVMQIVPRTTDLTILRQQVSELRQACATKDFERVMRLLKVSVPEFSSVADKRSGI